MNNESKIAEEKSVASETRQVTLIVNGQNISQAVKPRTHLGDFLRDDIGLTGTHLGCEHGVCGACVVLLDGKPIRSCITFAASCNNRSVTTIEGYGDDPVMDQLRRAFTEYHALQCGYCTPGMLATARDIVIRLPDADEKKIRAELSGNLCRCTGYMGIVDAIMAVLAQQKLNPDPAVIALRVPLTPLANSNTAAKSSSITIKPVIINSEVFEKNKDVTVSNIPSASTSGISPKGTVIEQVFELSHPADDVWMLMTDLPKVARCLPGAEILSEENGQVTGRISIKFGPMQASFEGQATLEVDQVKQQAMLIGVGRDKLSNSRARGQVFYSIEPTGEMNSLVHINMMYSLQGPLAQFSRSGIVQDFVRRLVEDFAKNVSKLLTDPNTTDPMPNSTINPISIFVEVLLKRIRRLLRIKD